MFAYKKPVFSSKNLLIQILCLMLLCGCTPRNSGDNQGFSEESSYGLSQDSFEMATDSTEDRVQSGSPIGSVYVYIHGCVMHPGVYKMAEGDRIFSVIAAAGGFSGNACEDYVNQAEVLQDGIRIWIPSLEEAAKLREEAGSILPYTTLNSDNSPQVEGSSGNNGSSSAGFGAVNINTADMDTLCTLPGIGQSKAAAIMEYRKQHGSFTKIEDIMNVSGIGQSSFEKLKSHISV